MTSITVRPVASVALALTIAIAVRARAADGELLRVFAPPHTPGDARTLHIDDLDHPAPFTADFASRADWEKRAAALREQVLVAEGLWPMPVKTPLNAVIHGRIDRDEYTIEKVFFCSTPGHYVSGNLYRPKAAPTGGKMPGVLCPHGHWPAGRFLWTSDKECRDQIAAAAEASMEGARSPLQARCAMLARMGCVVFHYDMVGYADDQPIAHRRGFTDTEAILRLQSTMGLQTWNSIRSLDFLLSLPDVDPARLAVTGSSGGGTQSIILGAADPRLAASFPAVMISMNMQGGCVCENAPLLRIGTNNVELAALMAPKPLGMSAANDWTKDIETRGLPQLKTIFGLFGAADRVAGRHFDFPHNYNLVSRTMMYNFFSAHLKLGLPSPVVEKPFVPVEPKDLSVYDAEHPRPADALDAPGLRQRLTDASNRQIAELATEPAEYTKMLRVALRVMLNEPAEGLPAKGQVLAGQLSGPRRAGTLLVEKGFLRRANSAEQVPFATVFPPEWNGEVVVWVHPDGKKSLFDNGDKLVAGAQKLIDAKSAVIAADLFLTGEYLTGKPGAGRKPPAAAPSNPNPAPSENPPYDAFTLGYNRSLLASRVHDLLTTIALARDWDESRPLRLVGFGEAGPWALLARAVAGDAVDRAAIDLNGFDFDQVTDGSDAMMLPGALKYGGIYGFVPLFPDRESLLAGARKTGAWGLARHAKRVTLKEEKPQPDELISWLLR